MQRNMDPQRRLREAFGALQAGRFDAARDAAAAIRNTPQGALLHALADAATGNVVPAAAVLHAVWRANPHARHPVLDLVELLGTAGLARESAAHLRAALAHAPADPVLLASLGAALAEHGPLNEAVAIFTQLAALHPADRDAHANLGKAFAAAGRFVDAEAAFARAGDGDPQRDLNRAVARLKSGDLVRGWPLFRARHALPGRAPGLPGTEMRDLHGVSSRRVLLLHDEGFGDTLQFIRYAPLLAELGAEVNVAVPEPLRRLMCLQGVTAVGSADPGSYDLWCRIPDLPGVFATTLDTIPPRLLCVMPPRLVQQWADKLPRGVRVGLAWAGAARRGNAAAMDTDRQRSIPRDRLGPLLAATGVQWISLQLGEASPAGVFDPMPGVTDFADTAAIIANLDLVVAVDTSLTHLAATMGKPVLLLDRFDNCWRWLHGRDDSPWYPGVLRIVRQSSPGDWNGVLARAAAMVADPGSWPGQDRH